jgi:hypothetical protein
VLTICPVNTTDGSATKQQNAPQIDAGGTWQTQIGTRHFDGPIADAAQSEFSFSPIVHILSFKKYGSFPYSFTSNDAHQ